MKIMRTVKHYLTIALLASLCLALSGCAATLWGGKHQDTQKSMAEENAKDTKALADAIKAVVGDPKMSSEGKIAAMAMGMMGYQAKQFNDQFKAKLPHSPVEENWVQGLLYGALALATGNGGSDKTVDKSVTDRSYIERISDTSTTSVVEKSGQ